MPCMHIAAHEPLVWLFLLLYRPEMKTSGGWLRLASRESTYYVYEIAPTAGSFLNRRTVHIYIRTIYINVYNMYLHVYAIICICI